MTSRERVLQAIAHRPTDRTPADFGKDLAFHGGVDTQRTLPSGSVNDVRAEVRSYIAITKAQGGYILCGSQDFIEDIPLDNILAMYDENAKRL